jgi:hypothetical protein
MMPKQRPRPDPSRDDASEVDRAIEAMTAEELRSFLRDAFCGLKDGTLISLEDALIARAARGSTGWKPSGPSRKVIDDVNAYVEAARRVGYADPDEVDQYLRQGMKAFLAGDSKTARALFEILVPPVAEYEIDLGQHELLDEVLTVDLHEYASQYLVSVYVTTPEENRPAALRTALDVVQQITWVNNPIEQMEAAAASSLPEIDTFLHRWLALLEAEPQEESGWERDSARWLREAVLRLEGLSGLERMARKTKQPDMIRAWCMAVVETGDWEKALRAYDDAVELAGDPYWFGELLDGAALAARQLKRKDLTERLKAAWMGSPSLVRLLRWLGSGKPSATEIRRRSGEAIQKCLVRAERERGLLDILIGDIQHAAKLLGGAPGLGWSGLYHPGHLLFPALAGLLAEGRSARLSSRLFAELEDLPHDPFDFAWPEDEGPRLETPLITKLITKARPATRLDPNERIVMLEAMKTAAKKRIEGVLDKKRRRSYGHAATLVACCLELAPAVGMQEDISGWIENLRREYRRFVAFQRELKSALDEISG